MKSTEPKTPEDLAAEAFPDDGSVHQWQNRRILRCALRKQAEQCRPYMAHRYGCSEYLCCTCGLDDILNSMK